MQRLVVPRVIAAVAQRLVDDPAAGLRLAHIGVETGKIPAGLGLGAQVRQRVLMCVMVRQIGQFLRVAVHIEQLVGVERAAIVFQFARPQADQRGL